MAFLAAANQLGPLIGHDGLLPADLICGRLTDAFRLASARLSRTAERFLVGLSRWRAARRGVDRRGALAARGARLRQCAGDARAVGALHVDRECRAALVLATAGKSSCSRPASSRVFLCPLLDGRPFPRRAPPVVVIWLYRWLIFRIMLGAGLIKLRGDACWRDLTCLYYHYETQPIPNPLSWWLHFRPHWFHQAGHVLESLRRAGRAVVRLRARARCVTSPGCLLVSFPGHPDLQRQSLVPELADDRAVPGVFRRHVLGAVAASLAGAARALAPRPHAQPSQRAGLRRRGAGRSSSRCSASSR